MLHVLAAPRTVLFTDADRIVSPEQRARYEELITRRIAGEPIQYITGRQEFYGLDLLVSPAVLIPRPETEVLVEAVLKRLVNDWPLRIADVGTGSGAIAVAIANQLRLARLTATDLSQAALAVARENALAHGLEGRICFLRSDLLEGVEEEGGFDAILSNPPYVPTGDRAALPMEVREFEPEAALFAGVDGLEIYRRLIPQAFGALNADGLLAMEIGYGQREAIARLLEDWHAVEFIDDLQQIARVVLARKP